MLSEQGKGTDKIAGGQTETNVEGRQKKKNKLN